MTMRVVGIAAVARNGVIGCDGKVPWRIPEDLKRFRAVTSGNTLILGRRTFENLPRRLGNRRIIVVTRNDWDDTDIEVAHSIKEALDLAAQTPERVCYVGGGAETYAAAWPHLTELDITRVHQAPEGDTHFPPIRWREWVEGERHLRDGYHYASYERIPAREDPYVAF